MASRLGPGVALAGMLLAMLAPAAAPAGGPVLVLRGVAALPSGEPVRKAYVTAVVNRRFNTTTDDSGRFALNLPLPDRAALAHDSTTLQLWVTARGLHFTAPDGQSSLGLILRLETAPDGSAHVLAGANDARLAALAARAVATGTRIEMTDVRFTGTLGQAFQAPFPPARTQIATVAVTRATKSAVPAPASTADSFRYVRPAADVAVAGGVTSAAHPTTGAAPSAPPSSHTPASAPPAAAATGSAAAGGKVAAGAAAGSAAASGKVTAGATATAGSTVPPRRDGDAVAPAVAGSDTGTCFCRIAGTVEATAGPLPEPLRVLVSIQGLGAPTDTVHLDMGSPRPFDLRGVPCGAHQLVVRALSSRRHYKVLDPEHTLALSCDRDRRTQPRILLVPR